MDVAFVQYPQHNVDGSDRRHYQNKLRIHGLLEHLRRSGKTAAYRRGDAKLRHGAINGLRRLR